MGGAGQQAKRAKEKSRGRKPNQAILPIFAEYAGAPSQFVWGTSARHRTSYLDGKFICEAKREGFLRRKLADVLVDLGIAVQADEFRSSRVRSSCASKTKHAASNIEFIQKSPARSIDGVESPKRKVDHDERFKRMSRSRHTSSAKQKLCRPSDSPKNPEQRKQNPSKQPQARRSISFDCSTATTRTTTFPSSCICFAIASGIQSAKFQLRPSNKEGGERPLSARL